MAKILRCPACGALWRLSGDLPSRCRCGECGTVFSTDKAETIDVADEKLEARLAERTAEQQAKLAEEERKRAREQREAQEGEALMTKLAKDMANFEGGATAASAEHAEPTLSTLAAAHATGSDTASADAESNMPADTAAPSPKKGSAFGRFLLFLVSLAALIVIAGAAMLYFHEPVLANMPYLRPAYENVCTKLPCPGFVWAQPKAFEATAELVAGDMVDLKRPDVRVTLRNASSYPQRLPIIEIKLLDPAGDTIVQRILEPAEYGVTAQPAVLPAGESMTVLVHVETPLPYEAAGAAVAPVEMQ